MPAQTRGFVTNLWQFTSKGGELVGWRSQSLDVNLVGPFEATSIVRHDMARYVMPEGDVGDIVILQTSWGPQQRMQLQRDGDTVYVTTGREWFRLDIGQEYIDKPMDTSPGNGRFYTVEGGHWWLRWWPVDWQLEQKGAVTFKNKDTCEILSVSGAIGTMRLAGVMDHYTVNGNLSFEDVAVLEWVVNGQVDERSYYAAGVGLIEWQKHDGRRSWAVQVIPAGEQEPNERETGCWQS